MTIGFLGLGEIGSAYSTGLAHKGAFVKGYDILMENPSYADRFTKFRDAGVHLAANTQNLIEGCDIVVAVTSSHVAAKTAEAAKPFIKPGQIYLELNSATPMIKDIIRNSLEGIDVVDGATMESPISKKHKALVLVSGKRGKYVADTLNSYGMNVRLVGETFGQASAVKIIRSIYFKGMEAVLMESMHAAYVLGLEDNIFKSICEFFIATPIDNILSTMIRTNAIHSLRRGEEVGGVVELLHDAGVDSTMSEASAKKLLWLASLELKTKFDGYVPDSIHSVLEEISKASKSKN